MLVRLYFNFSLASLLLNFNLLKFRYVRKLLLDIYIYVYTHFFSQQFFRDESRENDNGKSVKTIKRRKKKGKKKSGNRWRD